MMFFFDFFNLFAGVQTKTRFNYKNRVYGNFQNRFLKNDARPVRFQIIEKKNQIHSRPKNDILKTNIRRIKTIPKTKIK